MESGSHVVSSFNGVVSLADGILLLICSLVVDESVGDVISPICSVERVIEVLWPLIKLLTHWYFKSR